MGFLYRLSIGTNCNGRYAYAGTDHNISADIRALPTRHGHTDTGDHQCQRQE